MTCQLTDLSVQLYCPSPNRAFLSGISNILSQTERSHWNNKSRKTVCFFDRWRDCSDGVKTFQGKGDSRTGFHVLKEWNGSSEALRWLPPKGGRLCRPQPQTQRPRLHLCCSWRYRRGFFWWARPWQSARLQTSAPPFERCPWTSVAKRRFSSWLGD